MNKQLWKQTIRAYITGVRYQQGADISFIANVIFFFFFFGGGGGGGGNPLQDILTQFDEHLFGVLQKHHALKTVRYTWLQNMCEYGVLHFIYFYSQRHSTHLQYRELVRGVS